MSTALRVNSEPEDSFNILLSFEQGNNVLEYSVDSYRTYNSYYICQPRVSAFQSWLNISSDIGNNQIIVSTIIDEKPNYKFSFGRYNGTVVTKAINYYLNDIAKYAPGSIDDKGFLVPSETKFTSVLIKNDDFNELWITSLNSNALNVKGYKTNSIKFARGTMAGYNKSDNLVSDFQTELQNLSDSSKQANITYNSNGTEIIFRNINTRSGLKERDPIQLLSPIKINVTNPADSSIMISNVNPPTKVTDLWYKNEAWTNSRNPRYIFPLNAENNYLYMVCRNSDSIVPSNYLSQVQTVEAPLNTLTSSFFTTVEEFILNTISVVQVIGQAGITIDTKFSKLFVYNKDGDYVKELASFRQTDNVVQFSTTNLPADSKFRITIYAKANRIIRETDFIVNTSDQFIGVETNSASGNRLMRLAKTNDIRIVTDNPNSQNNYVVNYQYATQIISNVITDKMTKIFFNETLNELTYKIEAIYNGVRYEAKNYEIWFGKEVENIFLIITRRDTTALTANDLVNADNIIKGITAVGNPPLIVDHPITFIDGWYSDIISTSTLNTSYMTIIETINNDPFIKQSGAIFGLDSITFQCVIQFTESKNNFGFYLYFPIGGTSSSNRLFGFYNINSIVVSPDEVTISPDPVDLFDDGRFSLVNVTLSQLGGASFRSESKSLITLNAKNEYGASITTNEGSNYKKRLNNFVSGNLLLNLVDGKGNLIKLADRVTIQFEIQCFN